MRCGLYLRHQRSPQETYQTSPTHRGESANREAPARTLEQMALCSADKQHKQMQEITTRPKRTPMTLLYKTGSKCATSFTDTTHSMCLPPLLHGTVEAQTQPQETSDDKGTNSRKNSAGTPKPSIPSASAPTALSNYPTKDLGNESTIFPFTITKLRSAFTSLTQTITPQTLAPSSKIPHDYLQTLLYYINQAW